jgi:hypothetical protein
MHAWSEVEHDLLYKPLSGDVSVGEHAILDQINGLVLAGEIALEQLQVAVETRVSTPEQRFGNHYELASYLLKRVSERVKTEDYEPLIGAVNRLYRLLKASGKDTPSKLDEYTQNLMDGIMPELPLSQKMVVRLMREDPELIATYFEANFPEDDRPNPETIKSLKQMLDNLGACSKILDKKQKTVWSDDDRREVFKTIWPYVQLFMDVLSGRWGVIDRFIAGREALENIKSKFKTKDAELNSPDDI